MATLVQPHGQTLTRPAVSSTSGLWSWITTVDHKRIAILYGISAFGFFLLGGLEAMLIRTQLIVPNNDLLTAEQYNAMFTMHGTTMIFLAIMPLSVAFSTISYRSKLARETWPFLASTPLAFGSSSAAASCSI